MEGCHLWPRDARGTAASIFRDFTPVRYPIAWSCGVLVYIRACHLGSPGAWGNQYSFQFLGSCAWRTELRTAWSASESAA